jgi:hypothetical protein
MKKAISYKRKNQIFLHAVSKTTAGVWILDQPVFAVDASDISQLGVNIYEALNSSKEGVVHPTHWKGIFDPVLQLAGVKTWGTFAKTAKCVEIELETNSVSMVPTKNHGADGGFEQIDSKRVHAKTINPIDLGSTLLSAFEVAE